MPLSTIEFAPGVNAEITEAQGMAQIVDSQLIRFKYAGPKILPEKLGGWDRYYPVSVGSPVRALWAWEGITNDIYLAVGAEESLSVIYNGVGYDITPRTLTTNDAPSFTTVASSTTVTVDDTGITMSPYNSLFIETQVSIGDIVLFGSYAVNNVIDADTYTILSAIAAGSNAGPGGLVPEFTTTSGSPIVTVDLDDHGYALDDVFPALVLTTVGGIDIFGAYIVSEVVSPDQFKFVAQNGATSSTSGFMNGGDARITYYITLPPSDTPSGYGGGGYGLGGYGTGLLPGPSAGTPITATNWTLDNWGAVLIACPAGGPIYAWSPYTGAEQASKIVAAPSINGGIFVSQAQQILVAWASSSTPGLQDPLNVNWSHLGDFQNWTVSSQTQAGGQRLSSGSRIVGGMAGPSFNILWTDINVWSMDYIGPTPVYGFNVLGSNCGLIGRHAHVVLNSIVYWMGNNQFFALNGETVQTIPCTVWDFVFQDLDTANLDKITAASNSLFNEITFYFPSLTGGTGENDSYVKFNPVLNTWDYGRLDRTAWIDQSPAGRPIGGTSEGYLFQHETSPDADGQPMTSYFETGFYEIADGENLSFIDWIIPNFTYTREDSIQSAVVQISIKFTDYPGRPVKTRGPYSVDNTTEFVNSRLRGRYVSAKFLSDDLGSFWRMGAVKFRSVADGKR